jgi:hypothetical protein
MDQFKMLSQQQALTAAAAQSASGLRTTILLISRSIEELDEK